MRFYSVGSGLTTASGSREALYTKHYIMETPVDRYHIIYDGEFDYDYYRSERVIPKTVGQFTGLTDKNGTKIYEGDIVKEDDVSYNAETIIKGGIFEIKMLEGCWLVVEHKVKDAAWHFLDTFAKTVEVIGNIHDNSELLKGGASDA